MAPPWGCDRSGSICSGRAPASTVVTTGQCTAQKPQYPLTARLAFTVIVAIDPSLRLVLAEHLLLDAGEVTVQVGYALEDIRGGQGHDDLEDLADLGLQVDYREPAPRRLHRLLGRNDDPHARAADVSEALEVEHEGAGLALGDGRDVLLEVGVRVAVQRTRGTDRHEPLARLRSEGQRHVAL